MQTYKQQIQVLFKRILLVYALFTLSRILFHIFNSTHFQNIVSDELFSIYFYGLRFDSFSILLCNSLFILLSVLPINYFNSYGFHKYLRIWFFISNAVFLSINYIDMAYFKYIGKRSTYDIFHQMGGQTDVLKQIPYYFRDFWHILLTFIAVVYLMVKLYPKSKIKPQDKLNYSLKNSLAYTLSFVLIFGLTVLGLRGGVQRVPIDFADAGSYARPQHVSLVLNSPFTIIKSVSLAGLQEHTFYPNETAFKKLQPVKQYNNKTFKEQNVVVLLLESFSKEYTGISNRKSITPFLDSLMQHSLVFTNAWANGMKSIEGIPAVLASLPSLSHDPFINSQYCNNAINSFASLLKEKNYQTAFFHGGINGTMNFDVFAKQAGFDKYYGRDEYNNESDFDGNWGIWDDKYLPYCCKELSGFKQPFFASIFTLSSHHPYKIPDHLQGRFPRTILENSESIGYADYALRLFFEAASKTSWYKNTLFVLVADHASISVDPFYANTLGQHAIPLLLFKNDGSYKGINNRLIQQIDIMPTVLDTLGYDKPFFSLGKSVFSEQGEDYAIFYETGNHFLINDSMFFAYNNFKTLQTIKFTNDSTLDKNLKRFDTKQADDYLKLFMQMHNYLVLNNKMTAKTANTGK